MASNVALVLLAATLVNGFAKVLPLAWKLPCTYAIDASQSAVVLADVVVLVLVLVPVADWASLRALLEAPVGVAGGGGGGVVVAGAALVVVVPSLLGRLRLLQLFGGSANDGMVNKTDKIVKPLLF